MLKSTQIFRRSLKLKRVQNQQQKKTKITNLLLAFLDYHVSEENFTKLKASGFKSSNILEVVKDLQHYGYKVSVPSSAAEYRTKIYPALMEMHAKVGYWGVQIPVGGVPCDENGVLTEQGIKQLKEQKKAVEAAGLHISAVGGSWFQEWEKCIKPQIQSANVLGSKYLYGPFATTFLHFPEGVASGDDAIAWANKQVDNFASLLQQEIGPYARSKGVILCEEPLQRFERMPIRLKEAVALALKADINEFKIMIDMCHEFADGEGPEIYKGYVNQLAKAGKLHGVHVSPVHRGKLYESWFNKQYFDGFFKPLFENGYDGEISIETFDAIDPVVTPAKVNRKKFKHPVGVMINQLVYTAGMLEGMKK